MKHKKGIIISVILVFVVFTIFGGTRRTLRLSNNLEAKKLAFREMDYICDENPSEFLAIPYIYSGVKSNLRYITMPHYCGWISGEVSTINNIFYIATIPFKIVDLVVSFVTDTVVLPYTIEKQKKEGNILDPPYFAIGRIYVQRVDKIDDDKAIEYFEKGLNVLPKYFGIGNYREANIYLSDLDGTLFELGKLFDKKGNYEKAIYYYEQLIDLKLKQQINPSIIETYCKYLSRTYSKIGNNRKGRECFERINEYRRKNK